MGFSCNMLNYFGKQIHDCKSFLITYPYSYKKDCLAGKKEFVS